MLKFLAMNLGAELRKFLYAQTSLLDRRVQRTRLTYRYEIQCVARPHICASP